MTTTATPILNLPNMYVDNCQIAWASNTTLTVAAGQCRDSTNTYDIVNGAVTINAANNGLNGLDTGSLAASTWYAVHEIYDPVSGNIGGSMLSTSATAPLMPFGYSAFRQIGWWVTDGSSHLVKGYVAGNGKVRNHFYDQHISVLSAGSATTLTAIALSAAVPPVQNTPVILDVSFTPNTAGDSVAFSAGDSTGTALTSVSSVVASKAQLAQVNVMSRIASSKAELKYINSASSGSTTAYVAGFSYYI